MAVPAMRQVIAATKRLITRPGCGVAGLRGATLDMRTSCRVGEKEDVFRVILGYRIDCTLGIEDPSDRASRFRVMECAVAECLVSLQLPPDAHEKPGEADTAPDAKRPRTSVAAGVFAHRKT